MKRISTTNKELAFKNFSNTFFIHLLENNLLPKDLVFICIGTPHIQGDSLGPLIGELLKGYHIKDVHIYGTKEEPIHALNLHKRVIEIKKTHPDAFYIAVDAALGARGHLGNICIQDGPIFPGAGVKKSLPPIGDLSITAIVCPSGPFYNKRLAWTSKKRIAMQAEIISSGILRSLLMLSTLYKTKEFSH